MNTFEENLSYLLQEWCWGKAWENMARPRLFSDNTSLMVSRVGCDKNRKGTHVVVYRRVRIAGSKWFPEGVYDMINITRGDDRFLLMAIEDNTGLTISKSKRGDWNGEGRVAVDMKDFTGGGGMSMCQDGVELLSLVHPWVKESVRVISESLRQL